MFPNQVSSAVMTQDAKRNETDITTEELELENRHRGKSSSFFATNNNLSNLKLKSLPDQTSNTSNSLPTPRSSLDEEPDSETHLENDESDDTLKYPEGGWKAYSVVFASLLGMVCGFGLMNSTGAIESYLETNILPDTSSTTISWIFALYTFLTFGGTMFSGILFDNYGSKKVVIPGSLMLVGGIFATANSTKMWHFILSFGVCTGIGGSLLMSPMVNSIGHFFQKKRGLALGIAMPGASFGGVIWPQVCRSLYGKIGFTWTMRVIGFIFIGCLSVVSLLTDDRLPEIKEKSRNTEQPSMLRQLKHSVDFTTLKDQTFMLLVGALFMNEFSLILCFTYIPSYAINKGYSHSTSLTALTITNAAGILGRYLPSHLSDTYGNFNLICLMSSMMTVVIFVIWLPFGNKMPAFFMFCVIYGFSVAGTLSLTPLCTSAISKPSDFGKRYGTAYFFVSFGNLVCLPIGISITHTAAGYDGLVGFAGATCTVATCIFMYTRYKLAGFKRVVI